MHRGFAADPNQTKITATLFGERTAEFSQCGSCPCKRSDSRAAAVQRPRAMLRNHASFIRGARVGDKTAAETAPPDRRHSGHTTEASLGPLPTTKKHFETENHKTMCCLYATAWTEKGFSFSINSGACSWHCWQQLHRSEIRTQELSSSRWGRNNPRIRSFRKIRKHVWDCSVYMIA